MQQYICKTCHKHLKKPSIPPKSVWYKLYTFPVPPGLQNLNRLERVLILRRILFKKFTVMSKDQYAILTGAICNVSIDTSDVASVLFRETDSSGLVMVRLKQKLCFRGHVYFEVVSPGIIHSASLYFKKKKKTFYFMI